MINRLPFAIATAVKDFFDVLVIHPEVDCVGMEDLEEYVERLIINTQTLTTSALETDPLHSLRYKNVKGMVERLQKCGFSFWPKNSLLLYCARICEVYHCPAMGDADNEFTKELSPIMFTAVRQMNPFRL